MRKITRRTFLKLTALSLLFGKTSLFGGEMEHSGRRKNYWKRGYIRQQTLDASKIWEDKIKARIDGKWKWYTIRELPPEFMEWNTKSRLRDLENIKQRKPPSLHGPHSGMVATYGAGRLDSEFTLNNAVKGMGFLPRKDILPEKIKLLQDTMNSPFEEKIKILQDLYKNPDLLDKKRQTSLELYTTPDFETHTFLNLMENPVATVVFLDIPSYEIRTIAQLLDPNDPNLTEWERNAVEYVNLIHSYFHGEFPKKFITIIFHIIEVFDNSPGRKDAMGRRMVP